jgi:hypothetical protein
MKKGHPSQSKSALMKTFAEENNIPIHIITLEPSNEMKKFWDMFPEEHPDNKRKAHEILDQLIEDHPKEVIVALGNLL